MKNPSGAVSSASETFKPSTMKQNYSCIIANEKENKVKMLKNGLAATEYDDRHNRIVNQSLQKQMKHQ